MNILNGKKNNKCDKQATFGGFSLNIGLFFFITFGVFIKTIQRMEFVCYTVKVGFRLWNKTTRSDVKSQYAICTMLLVDYRIKANENKLSK